MARARRIVLGAGETSFPGWVATNRGELDVTDGALFRRLWPRPTVTHFLAEHVWEHLTPEQALAGVRHCAGALAPGGRLRIAVPDGWHPDPAYIERVRPGGTGLGADDHKVLYNAESLAALMREGRLEPIALEWRDAAGEFHRAPWSPQDGMVRRSAEHDERNREGQLVYTSLIMDGIKR